jgi:hypothetical protein
MCLYKRRCLKANTYLLAKLPGLVFALPPLLLSVPPLPRLPPWLAWPPLEAAALTSSVGLR